MRKRPLLLAAVTIAAGLAVFRTVDAQTPPPGGANLPKAPVGPPPTTTTVRPYADWTPTPAPPGYTPTQPPGAVRPAGGYLPPPKGYDSPPQPNRPRLTNPVTAGPGGVRPTGGTEIPPPNLDLPSFQPSAGGTPPVGPLPPPSISMDPANTDSKFTAPRLDPLPSSPAAGGVGAVPPLPVPTEPGVGSAPAPIAPPQPFGPIGGPATPVPTPPAATPTAPLVTPGADPLGSTSMRPIATSIAGLPGKVTHAVTLEAVCPETVVFGGEFRYELVVRNAGNIPVGGVRVEDELPAGAKYVGSDPPAELNTDKLSWSVGTLDAGAEKRIVVRVKPADEGEVRSRATVTYSAAVEAKTRVTRPRISVTVTGPEVSKAGESPVFQIKVTNAGTGPAERMILQAFLSEGIVHPQGAKLEMEMASLPPGETKTVPLKVGAGKAGLHWCQVTVAAQGSQDASAKASVNIVEPQLHVAQTGPGKCFVRAEPVYEITLSNPGTAATDPVTLYTVLPEGFEYLQASEGASYNAANRAVVWKLAGLPTGGSKAFSLKLRANAEGDGLLRTIAQATPPQPEPGVAVASGATMQPIARVLEAKTETAVKAEGVAAVRFELKDLEDPVELGKEAVYEVRVVNQGTGACTNVQLVAALAEGTAYTGSSGPTQAKTQGQSLVFDPIANLAVKGEAVYRVKIRGSAPGDMRFRVQLTCDQVRTPVVREESTQYVKQ